MPCTVTQKSKFKSSTSIRIRPLGLFLPPKTSPHLGCGLPIFLPFIITRPIREISITTRDWINSAQDRDYWGALVSVAFNLRVP